jgi:hypothetical protein
VSTAKALEVWTAQTVCDMGILLSILSFCLHIVRPYFERILGRFTLRVAADLWWVVYVALRDGSLFLSLLFGRLNLNMDLVADIKIALPFVTLGTVFLAGALVWKVFRNTEDVNYAYRVTTWLVAIGALLDTLGWVLVMEAPGEEYAAAKTAFWKTMVSWRSNANPQLSAVTFYLGFSALACLAGVAFVMALRLYSRSGDREEERVPTSA